jgi:hypothetical protein
MKRRKLEFNSIADYIELEPYPLKLNSNYIRTQIDITGIKSIDIICNTSYTLFLVYKSKDTIIIDIPEGSYLEIPNTPTFLLELSKIPLVNQYSLIKTENGFAAYSSDTPIEYENSGNGFVYHNKEIRKLNSGQILILHRHYADGILERFEQELVE